MKIFTAEANKMVTEGLKAEKKNKATIKEKIEHEEQKAYFLLYGRNLEWMI